MSQALAYCEKAEKNISIQDAHSLYFKQPEEKRERFIFRCGDPKCREEKNPLIVAALYDRPDRPGQKRVSPYYREHKLHAHIPNCTWIGVAGKKGDKTPTDTVDGDMSGSTLTAAGLLFKLKSRKKRSTNSSTPISASDSGGDDGGENPQGQKPVRSRIQPTTSKFMATVAANFLMFTKEERQAIPLAIEGKEKGTFDSICMSIHGYHPFYQPSRIYYGRVQVHELTNVFFIKFFKKVSPTGIKADRTSTAAVKLSKQWLEQNDRAVMERLRDFASNERVAWCFFYTETQCTVKENKAVFTVEEVDYFAISDDPEVETLEDSVAD
ncbi:hypothetical protein [Undibacterium sp. TS12]|uniref:hypothetical protein n=1 Tax=Undibacterium sp. TS12 TaxID=2908202 RepID=UPI001F4D057D|nr:hypothetical protein [Undibacterium sp. TS12]MCH8618033.1 hypothetical protein [Undibacterium sp. TS12]